jgi:hypothetical protein
MSLTSRFNLMTSWERIDETQYHRRLIRRIGHVRWEQDQNVRHQVRMSFFDDETTTLEEGGMIQSELDKRRILLVQLNIQHLNFMSTVMYLEEQNV